MEAGRPTMFWLAPGCNLCAVAVLLLLVLPPTSPGFTYPQVNLSAAIAERSQTGRSCADDGAAVCPNAFEFLPTLTVPFNKSRLAHVAERERLLPANSSHEEPVLHCRNVWRPRNYSNTRVYPSLQLAREPRSLNTTDNHT